jgi:23S rRNA pseudouridine2605 synthase
MREDRRRDGDKKRRTTDRRSEDRRAGGQGRPSYNKRGTTGRRVTRKRNEETDKVIVRLNRFIASSGVCSRREADKLIEQGLITVNGKIVKELGSKVNPGDDVRYAGERLNFEKFVYILMNKPKDFITTVKDTHDRKTVLDLIGGAVKERIYPVGRLDRQTTGLLLLTNDGELAKRMTHPSHEISKLYHVVTDKEVTKADVEKLTSGVDLEDGRVHADKVAYVGDGKNKKELGVELHSGKNRVIRRMFEALGYKVVKLDRVMFAGLSKKKIPRGKWRFLTDKEVGRLKMIS